LIRKFPAPPQSQSGAGARARSDQESLLASTQQSLAFELDRDCRSRQIGIVSNLIRNFFLAEKYRKFFEDSPRKR